MENLIFVSNCLVNTIHTLITTKFQPANENLLYVFKMAAKNDFLLHGKSHVTKIKKKNKNKNKKKNQTNKQTNKQKNTHTFSNEFINEIWLELGDCEYNYIAKINFENFTLVQF